jgi:hypothetical protein
VVENDQTVIFNEFTDKSSENQEVKNDDKSIENLEFKNTDKSIEN